MHQATTWYGGRPRPRRHCVRWGPAPQKSGTPLIFGPYLLWPNGRPSQLLLSSCIMNFPNSLELLGLLRISQLSSPETKFLIRSEYKSSAIDEMGDRGHNRNGPKRGGCCTLSRGGEAGSLSNTTWPGPRPTSVPSGVLLHPAVWPQQTLAENWGS